MNNVRKYTTQQLLDRVRLVKKFQIIPRGYWLCVVRSNEDAMTFDDKVYLFKGSQFILVTSCTSNKGNKGTAVLLADNWSYDCYQPSNGKTIRHHQGKMPCLRQVASIDYQRDFTKDGKTNPTTVIMRNIIHCNFHASDYNLNSTVVKVNIGGWSEGCIVANRLKDYRRILATIPDGALVSLCILTEFTPPN